MLFSLCCCCCCCCYVADSIRSTLFLLIIYILKLGGLFRRYRNQYFPRLSVYMTSWSQHKIWYEYKFMNLIRPTGDFYLVLVVNTVYP